MNLKVKEMSGLLYRNYCEKNSGNVFRYTLYFLPENVKKNGVFLDMFIG